MPGIRGMSGLLLGAAFLMGLFGEQPIGGLSSNEAAILLVLGATVLIMAGAVIEGFGRHWTYGVQAVAVSGGILMALIVAYSSREELHAALDRAIGDISSGRTVVTQNGEVVAARKTDGSFVVNGRVNGRDARQLFDFGGDGATAVAAADSGDGVSEEFGRLGHRVVRSQPREAIHHARIDREAVAETRRHRIRGQPVNRAIR